MATRKTRLRMEALLPWKQEFESLFPTPLACLLEIYKLLEIDISSCRICRSERVTLKRNHRMLKCHYCGAELWLTKGTFFEDMKHPKLWLMVLWFDLKRIAINMNQARKLAGAEYSSVFYLFKRIALRKEELAAEYEGDWVSSSSHVELFTKRSSLTPAGKGPKDEEWDLEDVPPSPPLSLPERQEEDTPASEAIDFTLESLDPIEREIYSLLSDVPTSADTMFAITRRDHCSLLASITTLELAGLLQKEGLNSYIRSKPPKSNAYHGGSSKPSPETQANIDSTIAHIKKVYHGISRKYLQLYAVDAWFHQNLCKKLKSAFLSNLKSLGRIKRQEISDYITPHRIKLCHPRLPLPGV